MDHQLSQIKVENGSMSLSFAHADHIISYIFHSKQYKIAICEQV